MVRKLLLLVIIGGAVFWYLKIHNPAVLEEIDQIENPNDIVLENILNRIKGQGDDALGQVAGAVTARNPDAVTYTDNKSEFSFNDNDDIICAGSTCKNETTNLTVKIPEKWQVDLVSINGDKSPVLELHDRNGPIVQKYYVSLDPVGQSNEITTLENNNNRRVIFYFIESDDANQLVVYETATGEKSGDETRYERLILTNQGSQVYKVDNHAIWSYRYTYIVVDADGRIWHASTNSNNLTQFEDKVLNNL